MSSRILYSDVLPATSDAVQRQLWIWSLDHARMRHPTSMIVEAIDREIKNRSIDPLYRSPVKA